MTRPAKSLLVRADAGHSIGVGHVMRCLSLIEQFIENGGQATLLTHDLPTSLRSRIEATGCDLETLHEETGSDQDAAHTCMVAFRSAKAAFFHGVKGDQLADWIVVDGYSFDDHYVEQLNEVAAQRLFVTDNSEYLPCDVVLNQNPYAINTEANDLSVLKLFGSRYTQLRSEFLDQNSRRALAPVEQSYSDGTGASAQRLIGKLQRVLVTCGGTDPAGATESIVRVLSEFEIDLEVVAVVGSTNPRLEELHQLCDQLSLNARLEVDPPSMPKLMQWADLAIAAAGSTCWELAYLGVPTLAFAVAENQIPVAKCVSESGFGIDLGWFDETISERISTEMSKLIQDPEQHNLMSQRGRELIDGRGAERVAKLLAAPVISLREATQDDTKMLWEWRNDPTVRAVSFSSDEIPFDSHAAWINRKLADASCLLWIAEHEGEPFGQVRFDLEGDSGEISISLSNKFRAAGLGTALIRRSTEQLLGGQHIKAITAKIKPDNIASQKAFIKAGYELAFESQTDSSLTYVAGAISIIDTPGILKRTA